VAGATRPVGGGAYSSPRSEPGGQNTPRAGRSVATVGSYTVSLGLFAQQVDQGSIFDEALATGVAAASGASVEDYSVDESATATAIANGTGVESYSYDDAGFGTVTASGTGVESFQPPVIYNDNATINTPGLYDAAVDVDTPVSHWKLGETGQATDRKGVQNLQAVSSPPTAESLVANNGSDAANSFDGARSPAIGYRCSDHRFQSGERGSKRRVPGHH
jgi:hypothetical protein